ncbi:helix-turn-helix domain-containing protein [Enterobacter ludwigii]|uniref:helix-turn-helix domain-containing protein n=1 Tax=Enterobacter ludwigii TaxID=299767 RepID=UPI003F7288FC
MKDETNSKIPPLALRLQQLMKKTGVNKSGLARICSVTPQSVGKWFRTGSISKESAIKISEAFGVSLAWLLDDAEGDSDLVVEDDFLPAALTDRQKLLLKLFERLPESEKDNHIEGLKEMVENYDKLFDELLKSRNIKELSKTTKK